MKDAIVNPSRLPNEPAVGPVAVLVGMQNDLDAVRRLFGSNMRADCRFLLSRLYRHHWEGLELSLAGPVIGAPYGAMLLEKLIVLGARRILFFGWCGSIHPALGIGDVLIPDRAASDEGTSRHYREGDTLPRASVEVLKIVEDALKNCGAVVHRGAVWSTDAPYRETREKVLHFREQGVLGVDMEVSALFSVAAYRRVEVGAVLVVSDELASLEWRPGFSRTRFKRARQVAAETIPLICKRLSQTSS